jgi:hypothetical protein
MRILLISKGDMLFQREDSSVAAKLDGLELEPEMVK